MWRRESEIDRQVWWCGACSDVETVSIHWGEERAGVNVKLSIYWSVYVPPFTFDHELWLVSKEIRECE